MSSAHKVQPVWVPGQTLLDHKFFAEIMMRSGHKFTSKRWHCPACGLNLGKARDVCPHCAADIRLRVPKWSYVSHCSCCGCIVGSDAIACENAKCGADLR